MYKHRALSGKQWYIFYSYHIYLLLMLFISILNMQYTVFKHVSFLSVLEEHAAATMISVDYGGISLLKNVSTYH